jgi:hypothetical protein
VKNSTDDQGWRTSTVGDMQYKLKSKNTEPIEKKLYIKSPESIKMYHIVLGLTSFHPEMALFLPQLAGFSAGFPPATYLRYASA